MNGPARGGASVVVAVEDESMKQLMTMFGGKTRTPVTLKGAESRPRAAILMVSRATMDKLLTVKAKTAELIGHGAA